MLNPRTHLPITVAVEHLGGCSTGLGFGGRRAPPAPSPGGPGCRHLVEKFPGLDLACRANHISCFILFRRRRRSPAQGGSGTEPRSLAPAGDGHDDDDEDDDDEDGVAAFKPCRLRSPWQAGIRLRFPGAWSLDLLEDGSALAPPPPPKKPKKVRKGPGEGGPQERGGIEQPQE